MIAYTERGSARRAAVEGARVRALLMQAKAAGDKVLDAHTKTQTTKKKT